MGGEAVKERAADETAFFWRAARHSIEITAADTDAASRQEWARRVYNSLSTHKLGTYINYPDDDRMTYSHEYWSSNYPRLQELKAQYDPDQIFDAPHGIVPQCKNCGMWI